MMQFRQGFSQLSIFLAALLGASYSQAQYCAATGPKCNTEANSFIIAVSTDNGFSKTSFCADGDTASLGYSDFTADTMLAQIGTDLTLTVRPGTPFVGDLMKVWVDFNADGDFGDAGENIDVNDAPGGTGDGVYTAVIPIPAGQTVNSSTRIRIRTFDATANPNPGPCAVTAYGEVEDYTIKFVAQSAPTALAYCASSSNCGAYAITRVAVTGDNGTQINNASTCTAGVGYTDYSDLSVTVSSGNAYTLDVSAPTGASTTNAQATLYIDWNNNGVFDPNESYLSPYSGGFSFNFTPTATATGLVRMRICTGNGSNLLNPTPAACGVREDEGETEDYSLFVVLPTDTIPACVDKTKCSPLDNAVNVCQKLTFRWNRAADATSYRFSILQGTTPIINAVSVTDTFYVVNQGLLPNTAYRWIALPFAGDNAGFDCDTLTFTTSPNLDPTIQFTPAGPIAACEEEVINLDGAPQNGTLPLTHSWNGANVLWNDMLSDTAIANPILTANQPVGSYRFGYRVVDANGCFAQDTLNVNINSKAIAGTLSANKTEVCEGEKVRFTLTDYDQTVTWEIETAPGVYSAYTMTAIDANTFETQALSITSKFRASVSKGSCMANTSALEIVVNASPAKPVIDVPATVACANDPIDLRVVNHTSGLTWSTGETTNSIVASQSGSYSVTVTDLEGCENSSDPVVITINALPMAPTIGVQGNLTFCEGGQVKLFSNYVGGNNWSTGQNTDTIVLSVSSPVVTLTYTNANGCQASSNPVDVTVLPAPAKPIVQVSGPAVLCEGLDYVLTTNYSSDLVWSTGAQTSSITVRTSGTYTATYFGANGCPAESDPFALALNPKPIAPQITVAGLLCEGSTVKLTSSYVGNNLWNTGAVSDAIDVSMTGTYSVSVVDINGCENSTSVELTFNTVPDQPVITASGPFCSGNSTTLSTSAIGNLLWSTGATTRSIEVNANSTIEVTVTDANGCFNTSLPFAVEFKAPPAKPIIQQIGDSIFTSVQAAAYRWYDADGQLLSVTDQGFFPSKGGNYFLEVVSADGCVSDRTEAFFFSGVGISEADKALLSLYPNPVADQIFITGSVVGQKLRVFLFDAMGRKVLDAVVEDQLNVSGIAEGVYSIQLMTTTGQNLATRKITIVR
ncbi:MAG TPA: GEVED domain-containing protein [Luteibaculaceae bacterium]|nr:GEVED domain-containing protein [Luteibaculaceae bacterium]